MNRYWNRSLKGSNKDLFVTFGDDVIFKHYPRVPFASLNSPWALLFVAFGDVKSELW